MFIFWDSFLFLSCGFFGTVYLSMPFSLFCFRNLLSCVNATCMDFYENMTLKIKVMRGVDDLCSQRGC